MHCADAVHQPEASVVTSTRPRRAAPPSALLASECAFLRRLVAQVKRVVSEEAKVLLTGERGTGKGVLARVLHEHSWRAVALCSSTRWVSPTRVCRCACCGSCRNGVTRELAVIVRSPRMSVSWWRPTSTCSTGARRTVSWGLLLQTARGALQTAAAARTSRRCGDAGTALPAPSTPESAPAGSTPRLWLC